MNKNERYEVHKRIEALTPQEMTEIGERLKKMMEAGTGSTEKSSEVHFRVGKNPGFLEKKPIPPGFYVFFGVF